MITLFLTDSHSTQACTMARETGVCGFYDQILAGWMKSMASVMGRRDLPLLAHLPEGWEAEKGPGAGKLQ